MDTSMVLGLVQAGWNHLRLQRPLAAWASWQRALRLAPDDKAAIRALETLESAVELPLAARAVYRFRTPTDPERRERWDARLRSGGLEELDTAAAAFAALVGDDPGDADALFNQALCLAWMGRNPEAIAALDQFVALIVRDDGPADRASEAWTLAEVLRLGAGAEHLADDLRFVWNVDSPAESATVLARWPNLRSIAMPADPLSGEKPIEGGRVYEWLDRPMPPGRGDDLPTVAPGQVPRVLATVIETGRALRLSTPDPAGFDRLAEPEMAPVAALLESARKEASPLPIAWADAALGTFRFPPGLDQATLADLTRGVVEHYFESIWIHQPRHALGDRAPLIAARMASAGDRRLAAKLAGVVRFREQLAIRPSHLLLYQGYPFDRLRRRLGLIGAEETGAVEADDLSCSSEAELDRLDPASLDAEHLADAFLAASTFLDDARTIRFAALLADREPASLARLDLSALFAPLVREALRDGEPDVALGRLNRAREIARDDRDRLAFATWTGEVLARAGRFGAALETYQSLLVMLAHAPDRAAAAALDGAETLFDNGASEQALALAIEARSLASQAGDAALSDRAGHLLHLMGP